MHNKLAWFALAMWVGYLEAVALFFWAVFHANFLLAQPVIIVLSLLIVGLTFISKKDVRHEIAELEEKTETVKKK